MAKHTFINAAQLKKALGADVDPLVQDVAAALNQAPDGAIIAGSECPVRDLLARFRQTVYEKAVQMRADAAASAFSPGGPAGRTKAPR
jgi:hypothetical protein